MDGHDGGGELPFVGAQRIDLVEELLCRFDEVSRTRVPQWVPLEAPTGWGKSRIAQEFYGRLAAERQDDGPYWPSSIVESINEDDTLARQQILGPDHPTTLTLRNNLAITLEGAGQASEAIEQFQALLADRERVLGPDHPSTFTTRNNLAVAMRDSGRLADALAQFRALVVDRERVQGSDHPETLTTRNNMACTLQDTGCVGEAIAQYRTILADSERVLGSDHPTTVLVRNNLARALKSREEGGRDERTTS